MIIRLSSDWTHEYCDNCLFWLGLATFWSSPAIVFFFNQYLASIKKLIKIHLFALKSFNKPAMMPWIFALFCWAIMVAVSLTAVWQQLELKLLDSMTVGAAPNRSEFPITIVGIDEASFSELGLQWPWPRRLHAELVNQLAAAGAAVIVFDIVFSEASNKEDDELFADAIYRAGNVVLAADRVYRESSSLRQWIRLDPLPIFLDAGAQVGLATVTLGPDLVVRQIPESSDALWRSMVVRLIQMNPEVGANLNIKPGSYIRYVGGDHTFPYVSYHEVVKPTGIIPADYFKGQVVIVGRDVKASPDVESAQADLFATPFLASTGWLTPGAEVHANILETAFGKGAITRLPEGAVAALLAFVAVLSAVAMRRWRPIWSLFLGVAIAGMLALVVWGAFLKLSLWVPAGSSLAVIPLMYLSLGGYSYLAEQARKKELIRTFSLYVTPQVVDELVAHPERIKLGGERREVTIMFTDLAGFTTISEALSPERVTHLLNRHFTDMTDVVLEYNGTVARFIGDAIMAFWGAPLDDDDQAYHAVAAAIAMQKAMNTMRETFAKEGLPQIYMRIGIHSGSAVVGNLGSAKRFDYTAIGDDVNLAARLEGINKLYGTNIMVSDDTARRIEGRITLRPIDKVIVKGKSQAVEVFSPCDDPKVIELSGQAIRLFRNQKWDAAESHLRELLAIVPEDDIAKLYLERIAALRIAPPPANWDGAMELEKL
ncbi:MAG: adenylate/guanylate cyclase domain-containing protein [Sulfuricellaceae bacterium]|nr:adenylate/guanylate cyclase domain-containing protein [Sulfuricellaceae bacterium]